MRPFAVLLTLSCLAAGTGGAQDSLPDSSARAPHLELSGFLLRRLPIDDPRHAFSLIPGVLLQSGDLGIDRAPVLLIRGGRRGAANVYVDGAPLRFQTLGDAGIGLGLNAIEDIAVITSVAPAAVSDAGSGTVLYTTRSGGERWNGAVRWDSDEPFGRGSNVGYNRLEGAVGGPIGGRTSFFASATLQGQRSAYRGPGAAAVPTYMPAGLDTIVGDGSGGLVALPLLAQWSGECEAGDNAGFECQGLRRPLDWSSARRLHAKVEHRYGGGRVSVTGLGGELQQRFFPGQSALNPALFEGRRAWSAAAIVNWRHDLGAMRGAPLALDVNVSLVGHSDRSGPLEADAELATRDPYLGISFSRLRLAGANSLNLPVTASLVRDLRTNSGTRGVPFFGGNDVVQAHRGNPYGLLAAGWWTHGLGGVLTDLDERRIQGRVALLWLPAMHQVMIGLDGERSEISGYSSILVRQLNTDAFVARPRRVGFFVGDRFVVGAQTVIDLGLRYDRFNAGGDFPNTPLFIASSGAPLWNPDAVTDDTAYANSVARVFHRGRSHGVVSPRLQFTQTLAQSVVLRLGYTRTAELPAWQDYFARTNSDLSATNTSLAVGRDVGFAIGSLIDAGVRAALNAYATLDVALYRKDQPDYLTRLVTFADPRDPTRVTAINVLTAAHGAHVEGIDLRFSWSKGWLQSAATYSLARTRTEESGAFVPVTDDIVSHATAVVATLRGPERGLFDGFEASALLRAQSGEPYTRLLNEARGTVTPDRTGRAQERLNASRTPWTTRLDLAIAKRMRVAGRNWSVFLDARNLLNARNLVALFAETGSTVNIFHRLETIGDPTLGTREYGLLWNEAQNSNALEPDGTTVNLTACGTWGNPVNCVALTRVERRFGDGNGLYTLTEQERAFNAYYEDFFGAWRFYGAGRTLRVGASLEF